LVPPVYRFTVQEGILMAGHDLKCVSQLFGINDLTGKLDKRADAVLGNVNNNIRIKCRALRAQLAATTLQAEYRPTEPMLKTLDRIKWSTTYRRLHRHHVDDSLPGPPSFFTRQRDGIPVPELKKFMFGYRKLFKMKLYSKTLETSYLVMNRQIWTNLKQNLSAGNEDDDNSANCLMCNQVENTMHLLFECPMYSEQAWSILSRAISQIVNNRVELHAYSVMYNLDIKGLSPTMNEQVLILIQEIKRNFIYRRFLRSTARGGVIVYDLRRLTAHLLLSVKKTIYQRTLEGSLTDFLEKLQDKLIDML
jgi:hypothetical protein